MGDNVDDSDIGDVCGGVDGCMSCCGGDEISVIVFGGAVPVVETNK